MTETKTQRNLAIVEEYMRGATVKELAERFGLSPSRIGHITQRYGAGERRRQQVAAARQTPEGKDG